MLSRLATQSITDIINGFIREIQSSHHDHNIPQLINNLCVQFYNDPEYFLKYNTMAFKLQKDKRKFKKNWKGLGAQYGTCYGNVVISNIYSKYVWTFNVFDISGIVAIGIDIADETHCTYRDFYDGVSRDSYALEIRSNRIGVLYHDGISINKQYGHYINYSKNNDNYITMELNVTNKTLKYYINNVDEGIAFSNIHFDYDTKYNMAVYLDRLTVELVLFSAFMK